MYMAWKSVLLISIDIRIICDVFYVVVSVADMSIWKHCIRSRDSEPGKPYISLYRVNHGVT